MDEAKANINASLNVVVPQDVAVDVADYIEGRLERIKRDIGQWDVSLSTIMIATATIRPQEDAAKETTAGGLG